MEEGCKAGSLKYLNKKKSRPLSISSTVRGHIGHGGGEEAVSNCFQMYGSAQISRGPSVTDVVDGI